MFQDQDHLSSRYRFRRRTTLAPGSGAVHGSISSESTPASGNRTQSADCGKRVRFGALFAAMDDVEAGPSEIHGDGDFSGADTAVVEDSSRSSSFNRGGGGGGVGDDVDDGKENGGDIELRDYSNKPKTDSSRHIDSIELSFHGRREGGKRGKTMFSRSGSGNIGWKKSRKLTFLGDAFLREGVDTDNDEDHMISTEYDQDVGEDDQVLGALSITGVVAEDEWFCPLEELMLDPSEPVIMRRALNKHQGIHNMRAVRLRQLANIAGYVLFVTFVVLVFGSVRILRCRAS